MKDWITLTAIISLIIAPFAVRLIFPSVFKNMLLEDLRVRKGKYYSTVSTGIKILVLNFALICSIALIGLILQERDNFKWYGALPIISYIFSTIALLTVYIVFSYRFVFDKHTKKIFQYRPFRKKKTFDFSELNKYKEKFDDYFVVYDHSGNKLFS
ncbi:MAG: hypothetical protein EOM87_10030, partial [Clostridia bacterium]|nr:hypothetical protein [Clostridia bacterium]